MGEEVLFRLTEGLETDRAASPERVVVLAETLSEVLVQLVEQPIDFRAVFLGITVPLQAFDYVSLEHVDLVIVETLRSYKLESGSFFRELRKREISPVMKWIGMLVLTDVLKWSFRVSVTAIFELSEPTSGVRFKSNSITSTGVVSSGF